MQRMRPLKQQHKGLSAYLLYDHAFKKPNITPDPRRLINSYTKKQKYIHYLYNLSQQNYPFPRLWISHNASTLSSFLYNSTYMHQIFPGYHSKTNISEACSVSIIRLLSKMLIYLLSVKTSNLTQCNLQYVHDFYSQPNFQTHAKQNTPYISP
jgi:hypothetical protein